MGLMIPPGENLVTYYLLPLLGVNRKSFSTSFKQTYTDKNCRKIYVELGKNMKVPSYKYNPFYVAEIVHQGNIIVMFSLPEKWYSDADLFKAGQYSKFSKQAKNIIYNTSTLPYNKTMSNFKNSDPILQALDHTKYLRDWLEKRLGIEPMPDSAELITKPLDHWFIENRLS